MASDAVFRVAADMAEYITGMARADAATKKVGRSAAGIGDQVGASIVKIELLNRALNAAGRAISGVMDKATGAATNAGERAMGMATSLGSLGIKDINGAIKSLSGGQGGTTADQKAQFAKSLAAANKQRKVPMSPDEAQAALSAFTNFGEFGFGAGGEDLISGVSQGRSVASITSAGAQRFQSISAAATDPLSPLAQGLRIQRDREMARGAEESKLLASGSAEAAQIAAMRVTAANDPGGPVSIIQGVLGDTAATALNRAMTGAVGGENAAARSMERSANASADMASQWRKLLVSPNMATETR